MPQTKRSSSKMQRHREKLRAQGLRPVQIWVADTRAPGFAEEALRQGRIVGVSYEGADKELIEFWERMAVEASADAWR